MLYNVKKVGVWIWGFATLLAVLNAFNGAWMWTAYGSDYVFQPYYLGQFTGDVSVTTYVGVSIAITFLCLGVATFSVMDVLSNNRRLAAIEHMVTQHGDDLASGFTAGQDAVATVKSLVVQHGDAVADEFATSQNAVEATGLALQTLMERQQQANEVFLEAQTSVKSYVLNALYESSESATAQVRDLLAKNRDALDDGFSASIGAIESTRHALERWTTHQNQANEAFLEAQTSVKSSVSNALYEQEKANATHFSDLETTLCGLTGEIFDGVAKIDAQSRRDAARRMARLDKVVKKTKRDVVALKRQIAAVEHTLAYPESRMTGQSSPVAVKGIGPQTLRQLEAMGVTNAGEFLHADPHVVAQNTRLSDEMAHRLQGKIQLLMFPDMDVTDTELLEMTGVRNAKDMAAQDPLELSIRLAEAANAYAEAKGLDPETPTLEAVISWIQIAKL